MDKKYRIILWDESTAEDSAGIFTLRVEQTVSDLSQTGIYQGIPFIDDKASDEVRTRTIINGFIQFLAGRIGKPNLRLILVPATEAIYLALIDRGSIFYLSVDSIGAEQMKDWCVAGSILNAIDRGTVASATTLASLGIQRPSQRLLLEKGMLAFFSTNACHYGRRVANWC